MTARVAGLASQFGELLIEAAPGMPSAELVVAPRSAAEAARVLDAASEHRLSVLIWGGGTHQGFGARIEPDLVVSTAALDRLIDWSPEDLTVVVEAGMPVADLEELLFGSGQTAVLPEAPGAATVGGVVAAGASGWRRLRYGPTRDRILEGMLATGDGRVVRTGARVVKNVTGYDIPRLLAGSLGALGVITQVALKLWPRGRHAVTLSVDDADEAGATAYRPQAVIESDGVGRVYLAGTEAELEAQAAAIGGRAAPGLQWPEPITGEIVVVVRVPAAHTRAAIERVPPGWSYQAGIGVGEVTMAGDRDHADAVMSLRAWSETLGGTVALAHAPPEVYESVDPWGDPGPAIDLQRRVKAAFDPLRVCNPGRLPGGL